ncbi:MAG: NUDIX hydrolase [Chloroflexia bacterium]|nr:NUDIX hydrolase [Chloroflexia bacterium]
MRSAGAPRWLEWAREMLAMAQTGLTYAADPYDRDRYERLREIAAEIVAAHGDLESSPVHDLFARDTGHATPKVDVRGAIFREDTVFLVRERSDGNWTLPGGWADPGETPSAAVVREIREESGLETRATRLLACWDRDAQGHPPAAFYAYKLFFACEVIREGTLPENRETSEAAYFPVDALPPLSLARVTPTEVRALFALHHHPEQAAAFD